MFKPNISLFLDTWTPFICAFCPRFRLHATHTRICIFFSIHTLALVLRFNTDLCFCFFAVFHSLILALCFTAHFAPVHVYVSTWTCSYLFSSLSFALALCSCSLHSSTPLLLFLCFTPNIRSWSLLHGRDIPCLTFTLFANN